MIMGTFAWLAWPSTGALAQDGAAPGVGAASAEPAAASRRERRRAAQAATPVAPQATAPAAVATTAPVAASAPAAAAEPAADEPATICKNIKPLGTRMAKRVCGTPEQWAALEKKTTDAASDDLRQVRSTGGVIATTPGPTSTP
jgi:predicted lipid-binding transport protein (Tim44 family)